MKYICLCYDEEDKIRAMAPSEWSKLMDETYGFLDVLAADGKLLDANPLQSVRNATSIRVRDDRVITTDGPFAETKEQLGGYFMIEARDLDEALRIAAGWPNARNGTVEVRPVNDRLHGEGRYS